MNIRTINAVLARHGNFLEGVWNGEITRVSEETAKAVSDLRAVHAVMTDDEGNVRLTRSYREFLERILGSRGHFGSSRSVADDLNRLKAAAEDAADADTRQDETGATRALAEGSDIIWELADTIESSILAFERILHDGLGESGSRTARIRRMEFYRERISGLRESFDFLVRDPARNAISHPSCRDLRREFSRMIGNNLAAMAQRVNRAADEINRLLILDQNILAETRRTRAILRALKDMGMRERIETAVLADELPVLPADGWGPLVDPRDPELEDLRERIAQTLKPAKRRERVQVADAGVVLDFSDDPAPSEEESADDLLSLRFEADLKVGSLVSLREWIAKNKTSSDEADIVFETIMTGIITMSGVFEFDFVPPLSQNTSNQIHDLLVGIAA